ncbi:hypothetical protein P879_05320 [Paragonimus westermani]|uniref:DUF4200 domain-containing protein n=1 Tax=Paragonimus westermani TaxID=34504 RepID=A0A8T0DHU4_9TREM|nr:hypothetical protein P879_05320 [Paragonimus westermani]
MLPPGLSRNNTSEHNSQKLRSTAGRFIHGSIQLGSSSSETEIDAAKSAGRILPVCCEVSVGNTMEAKRGSTLEYYVKMSQFSEEMGRYQEQRKLLSQGLQDFETRRINFRRFILDNVSKLQRQQYAIKENRHLQELGIAELRKITQEMDEALQRREQLQRKLSKLRVYEAMVMDTLQLLPKDYIRSNTCPADSLVCRYSILCHTQDILLSEVYAKQETVERETRELCNTRMTSVENLLSESSKLKTIGNQWRREQDELQHCIEQCERNKDKVWEECVRFFTILRALRNIAEKAASGLCNLSTHPVTNQHVGFA